MSRKEIEEFGRKKLKESEVVICDFLKRKVGRHLVAILLGKPEKPNFPRADAYLYKNAKLNGWEALKIEECYIAARVVDQIRHLEKGVDERVARNWLMMPCWHLGDQVPICAIRDGKAYGHLSAIGAAKTFVLNR